MAGDISPTLDTNVDTKQENCGNGNDQKNVRL